MRRGTITLLVILMLCILTGCAHELNIKNLSEYQNHPVTSVEKPMVLGLTATNGDPDVNQLTAGVVKGLQRASARPIYPFNPSGEKRASAIAHMTVTPDRHGSGWNFPINWPGFLIFTPAWNGYVYRVNYNVDVILCNQDNQKFDELKLPIHLNIRHADIDRTWTEIGWLEWGVIPFIGAFVFTTYDDDVTQELGGKIESPVGDYIAQEIVKSLNLHQAEIASLVEKPVLETKPVQELTPTPNTASGFQGVVNSGTAHLAPKRPTTQSGQTVPSW